MNAKRKGNRNEHRAIRILESAGYSCTRAAASLGAFDIIAVGPAGVRLVQVKSNRWPSGAEMGVISLFAVPPGCTREVWRFDDYARAPMIRTV